MSKNLFKIVSITMIVVMLFAFVGCDKKPVNNPNEEPTLEVVEPVSGENNEKKNNEEKPGTTEKVEGTTQKSETKKNESTTKPSETTTKKTPVTQKTESTTKKNVPSTQKPAPTTKKVENTTKKPTPVTQKPAEQTTKKPAENTTKKPAENLNRIGDGFFWEQDLPRAGMIYDENGDRVNSLADIPEGGEYCEYDSNGYYEFKHKPYSPGNEPDFSHCSICGKETGYKDGVPGCARGGCSIYLADTNCYFCGNPVKNGQCHTCP